MQPFLIPGFATGKYLATEPWSAPQDAWPILRNWYLRRKILQKRAGYVEFGEIVHTDTGADTDTNPGNAVMGIKQYKGASKKLLAMDIERINLWDATNGVFVDLTRNRLRFKTAGTVITAAADDIFGASSAATGTIEAIIIGNGTFAGGDASGDILFSNTTKSGTFTTGETLTKAAIAVTGYATADAGASTEVTTTSAHGLVTGNQSVIAGYGGTGAYNGTHTITLVNTTKYKISVAFDDDNATKGTSAPYVGLNNEGGDSTDGEFSGNEQHFFDVQNWQNTAYLNNSNDQMQKFDGIDLTRFNIDLDIEGGPDNDVDWARFMVIYKERIGLLRTQEDGTEHERRFRFGEINTPGIFKNASAIDAPNDDEIMGYSWLNGELIVWFKQQAKKIISTGVTNAPFRWEDIESNDEGVFGPYSVMTIKSRSRGVGQARIVLTDGRDVDFADQLIIDFVGSWNAASVKYTYTDIVKQLDQLWTTYAESGETFPNSILVFNYEDSNYSTYDIPAHVVSSLPQEVLTQEATMDGLGILTWDEASQAWDDSDITAGFPVNFIGLRDGKVYRANSGNDDAGSDIACSARSARFNPWLKQGLQARLGWMWMLIDKDPNATVDVLFFSGTEDAAYKTETVTADETGTSKDKVWKKIYAGAVDDFHRIGLDNNGSDNRPRIHAIILWMEPAGRIL